VERALERILGDLSARYRAASRLLLWGWFSGIALYFAILHFTLGNQAGLCLGALAVIFLCFWNDWTRRLMAGATPFLAQGVVYELTHLTKPLLRSRHIHIVEPYLFDRAWFGVKTAAGVLTPNELFALHHCAFVDFIAGLPYILYIYEVLAFLLFLSFTRTQPGRRHLLHRFGATFFLMSVAGYAIYYLYPAAPPWYVRLHGFGPPDFNAVASPASAERWDKLTGIPYFHSFYSLTADVFGAIPSLHVAFAGIVALYAPLVRKLWLTISAATLYLLMSFSAVYLQHHYVLDVLAGSALALAAFTMDRLVGWLVSRRRLTVSDADSGVAAQS
jgi:membrane-associated phospholipid phosphatase